MAEARALQRVCFALVRSERADEPGQDAQLQQSPQVSMCSVASCSHTCFEVEQLGRYLRTAHSQQEQAEVPAQRHAENGLGFYNCQLVSFKRYILFGYKAYALHF
ncbi:hypothetical protein FVE85_7678 [Porphyridium purpureum]|uniref:Uncharacterized protein n=1 Tax=Porphyridium purpureum TaxID=35688 RepID=A0A5J4Z8G1_PORPP|nr:hypothetical protein FVE85_6975 [Porphyridium purpureum]KAA8500093.1 hypothetical protein FVE85_7678 [Porphyridium purpureum]|eukprot:POR0136..scf295_1